MRVLVVAAVTLALVAAAFGGGYALGDSTAAAPRGTGAADGPGFLPAAGWNVVQTGLTVPPEGPSAIAANVPIAPRDLKIGGRPTVTIKGLGPDEMLLYARFIPGGQIAAVDRQFPKRQTPLRLRDARPGSLEGLTNSGRTLRLLAQVASYDIDVLIIFGDAQPSNALLKEADAELGRLVVAPCPQAAYVLSRQDKADAEAFVMTWLSAHYPRPHSELRGASARVTIVADGGSQRARTAVASCGDQLARRVAEVNVMFPTRAVPTPAGRFPVAYLIYQTKDGWRIWRPV